MAALNFPSSPAVNATYTASGRTWTWDGIAWTSSNALTSSQVTTALGFTPYNATNPNGYAPGTVTSIGLTVPTGLSVAGTPITTSGTLAISLTAGYSIPTTASQTNWDTAYANSFHWDGGATGLTAATGRTSLGGTTLGQSVFTLANPSAITFPRFNADNTVSALDAATFRTAISAGTVTSISGAGTVSGLTLSGSVSTTGSLTLGGTLSVVPSNFAAQAANTVLIAPNGSSGTPTFRTLVSADIPALDASKITTGVFSSALLPSYVDDVLEYNNLAAFPATGETGKIYVALDTNKTYRWSGTVYVFITSGAVDSVGGYTGVISASNLLTALTTVDGNGSGLDADLLDGQHASAFYLASNPSGYTTNTGTVTGVTATAPVVSSGGNAPVISMAAANSTTNGYMTSTYAAKLDGIAAGATTNTGTVTSVGGSGTVAGISLSGTITTAGTLQLSGTLSTPANTINDSTLTGQNFIRLTNPNAITFIRINADNSISTLDAATFRTAIGAGSGSGSGTVTSVSGTGTVSGLTLSGTVTSSGNLTLGGTLSLTSGQVTTALGYTPMSLYNGSSSADYDTLTTSGIWRNTGGTNGPAGPAHTTLITAMQSDGNYGYQLASDGTNMYSRDKGTAWTTWKTLLTSVNYTTYSPTLTGSGASGTWGISITGNAATATTAATAATATIFSTVRSNYKGVTDGTVAGQLMWKNYGNNHTLFDASNGTSPTGTTITRYTPDFPITSGTSTSTWGEPIVLMGFNGSNTYGVKVDWSRYAESAGSVTNGITTSNYNSYSPTLTGTGASGTWGISITGNAANITGTIASLTGVTVTNLNTAWTTPGTSISSGLYLYRYQNDALNAPAITDNANWLINLYSHPSGGTASYGHQLTASDTDNIYFRRVANGGFGTWYNFLHSGNYSSYVLPLTGGTLTGGLSATSLFSSTSVQNASQLMDGSSIYLINKAGNGWINFATRDTSGTEARYNLSGIGSITTQSNVILGSYLRIGVDNGDWTTGNYFRGASDHFVLGVQPGGTLYLNYGNSSGTTRIEGTTLIGGNQVLHAANYNSYALPLGGGSLTGALYQATTDSSSKITFNTPGAYYVGLAGNVSNNLSIVNYSAPSGAAGNVIASYAILHAGNYTGFDSIIRAIGYNTASNDWNSLGNTYHNSIEEIQTANFTSTSNGPTSASYTYGTLLNLFSQTSSKAQIYISHAGNDLIFRGGWGTGSWQTWNKVLTNQNYTSYSPTIAGGGATGTWSISITGNAATASNSSQLGGSDAQYYVKGNGVNTWGYRTTNISDGASGLSSGFYDISTGTNMPSASWYHLISNAHYNSGSGNQYEFQLATEFWNKTDFYIRSISPGSIGAWRTILHNGNYNSYSPTLTGTGASGTWGISVTGSSASCTGNSATASYAAEVNAAFGRTDATAYPVCWIANNTNKSQAYSCAAVTITSSTGQLSASILYASGNVTAYSDERVKTNWTNFGNNFVEEFAKIKSGTYDRIDVVLTQVGVSAQSLQKVMPAAVSEDENGMLSVSYGHAALASSVELAKRIVEQDERIARLEAIINKLIEDK